LFNLWIQGFCAYPLSFANPGRFGEATNEGAQSYKKITQAISKNHQVPDN
jgi:hypothetical protein